MHRKQIKFFFHLINKSFKQMNTFASSGNYKQAIVSRDNAHEMVSEMKDYLEDMGYSVDLSLPEIMSEDNIQELHDEVDQIIMMKVNPIKNFVDKLESGESLSTPTNMQFYNNNRVEIEAEMKKRSV